MHGARPTTYRIPESAVTRILEQLSTEAEWLGSDAEAEVLFGDCRVGDDETGRLALRFGLSPGFGELRAETSRSGQVGPVFAAGPIEELLLSLGLRRLQRTVTLRQAFKVGSARVELVHIDPAGWFCELRPGDREADLLEVARRLGLSDLQREASAELPFVARWDVRHTGRRRLDRREVWSEVDVERRRGSDRRQGRPERRGIPILNLVPS